MVVGLQPQDGPAHFGMADHGTGLNRRVTAGLGAGSSRGEQRECGKEANESMHGERAYTGHQARRAGPSGRLFQRGPQVGLGGGLLGEGAVLGLVQ